MGCHSGNGMILAISAPAGRGRCLAAQIVPRLDWWTRICPICGAKTRGGTGTPPALKNLKNVFALAAAKPHSNRQLNLEWKNGTKF
jgi:hypothetical protein